MTQIWAVLVNSTISHIRGLKCVCTLQSEQQKLSEMTLPLEKVSVFCLTLALLLPSCSAKPGGPLPCEFEATQCNSWCFGLTLRNKNLNFDFAWIIRLMKTKTHTNQALQICIDLQSLLDFLPVDFCGIPHLHCSVPCGNSQSPSEDNGSLCFQGNQTLRRKGRSACEYYAF